MYRLCDVRSSGTQHTYNRLNNSKYYLPGISFTYSAIFLPSFPLLGSYIKKNKDHSHTLPETASQVQKHEPTPNSLPVTVSRVKIHDTTPNSLGRHQNMIQS